MKDHTFRTHLIDDSKVVKEIIADIGERFGWDCTIEKDTLDSTKGTLSDAFKHWLIHL